MNQIKSVTAIEKSPEPIPPSVKYEYKGLRRSVAAVFLSRFYCIRLNAVRSLIIRFVLKFERSDLYSPSIRWIAWKYHGLDIGLYTDCHEDILNNFEPMTRIGRYCSIANTAKAYNRQFPKGVLSLHEFFYDPSWKVVQRDGRNPGQLDIGHDVWIGHNAVILPTVSSIGTGAVIGANSVVKGNVTPYAIMAGNPARRVGNRFPKDKIEELLASEWFKKSIEDIKADIDDMHLSLNDRTILT